MWGGGRAGDVYFALERDGTESIVGNSRFPKKNETDDRWTKTKSRLSRIFGEFIILLASASPFIVITILTKSYFS